MVNSNEVNDFNFTLNLCLNNIKNNYDNKLSKKDNAEDLKQVLNQLLSYLDDYIDDPLVGYVIQKAFKKYRIIRKYEPLCKMSKDELYNYSKKQFYYIFSFYSENINDLIKYHSKDIKKVVCNLGKDVQDELSLINIF